MRWPGAVSPALAADLGRAQRLLLPLARRLLPNLAIGNGLEPGWISRDPAVVQAYLDDPLVHDRITPRLAGVIVDGGAAVRSVAARWVVPTLLMWAGSDRCVAPAGSAGFARAAPPDRVQARVFGPLFHEILNEPEQRDVFDCLRAWLGRY